MSFLLIDSGWDKVIKDACLERGDSIRIICPFIKLKTAERLLRHRRPNPIQVITRFCLDDFAAGVSDVESLRLLLRNGARIRGIQNLHAKLYLFGERRAIVTSANLTESALSRNHEFGFVAEEDLIVSGCREYFDRLWSRGGGDLSESRIASWTVRLEAHRTAGAPPWAPKLGDEGTDAEIPPELVSPEGWVREAQQSFVKFFGDAATSRAIRSLKIYDEVESSGCHWACTYPRGKRPRQVRDGAIMFMGRLVKGPEDILIYGRAVGLGHTPGRDDATEDEINVRSWKRQWPHYVRVEGAAFIAGTLSNGVSLFEMMRELGAQSFISTQRNAAIGIGNTDPRKAYMRKPAVQLTPLAMSWLNERLERAFQHHGTLAADDLAKLDWPPV